MAAASRVYVTETGEKIHGMMAEFATPADLVHACEKIRDAGFSAWDSFSPFPVHGMEEAMGIKRTILPVLVFCGGMTGAGLGFLMQWWMQGVDYPMVTQGKPFWTWQAFVPITFELGILFAAFTSIIGMLALNGLPRWNHPLLKKERFLASSDDRFFISIDAGDKNFDPDKVRVLFEKAHATSIELVEE
jgi:hypothetical protein